MNERTDDEKDFYEKARRAGLLESGHNDEGEIEWIGTERNWQRLRKLENQDDLAIEQAIEDSRE